MSSGSEGDYDDDVEQDKQDNKMESQELGFEDSDQMDQDYQNYQQHDQHQKKMVIQQDETDKSCATYAFLDEDHTLGNALRYILVNRPDVEFCGYSLPHPSENKMNLRLQTIKSIPTDKVLNEGLDTLSKMCDVIRSKFDQANYKFNQKHKQTLQQK